MVVVLAVFRQRLSCYQCAKEIEGKSGMQVREGRHFSAKRGSNSKRK